MPGIRCRAFAKINLSLDVLGRRSDGYHEVDLIMQLLELHDLIEVEWTPDEKAEAERADFRDGITTVREALAGWVQITSDHPGLACDESNLAWKAYERMARAYEERRGYRPLGKLQIHIAKRIPLAAGLAGGSADCAAVLHACNYLWEMGLDLEALCVLGAELGADVPFALRGQALGNPELGMEEAPGAMYAARGRGIGEELEALPSVEGEVLLLTPPERSPRRRSTGAWTERIPACPWLLSWDLAAWPPAS